MKEPQSPKVFTLIRNKDATGISGTGKVLDGVVFHTGQVVVCWRTDTNQETGFSSIAIYPSWEAFKHIHIDSHPENESEVVWNTSA
jgi:hypothetical protein